MGNYVVHQYEIQMRGGVCAKHPVSCLVRDIVNSLFGRTDITIFDVTYGRGSFYATFKPRILIAADPKIWDWEVKPDIFIPKPAWSSHKVLKKMGLQGKIDLVVIDPPWGVFDHSYHYMWKHYNFLFGTPRDIIKYGMKAAMELHVDYVLIHYNEVYCESPFKVRDAYKYIFVSRYLRQDLRNYPKHSYFYVLVK